jgi:hypothetical protein
LIAVWSFDRLIANLSPIALLPPWSWNSIIGKISLAHF